MAGGVSTVKSKVQIDATIGGALADFVSVLDATFEHGRTYLENTGIGQNSATGIYGEWSGRITLQVAWLRTDHGTVEGQIAAAGNTLTVSYQLNNSDGTDVKVGECRFTQVGHSVAKGQLCIATFTGVTEGPWTINGTSTGS